MMNEALKLLKDKMSGHIDSRDTERGTLLNWPNARVQVDGDPVPYESDKLVIADYLQDRRVPVTFEVEQPAVSTLQGTLVIPSPLKAGDRLIVSRLSDQRYYVHGKG
ncbi:hypothetical protein [Paenibacillus sp. SN-8-1]|uniref:hypothetical protein n=1 Tax=Paenibacillus sp. SN-8-1 TaxID=3435409 RepID=UPI003D9AADA2